MLLGGNYCVFGASLHLVKFDLDLCYWELKLLAAYRASRKAWLCMCIGVIIHYVYNYTHAVYLSIS